MCFIISAYAQQQPKDIIGAHFSVMGYAAIVQDSQDTVHMEHIITMTCVSPAFLQ